MDIEEIVVNLKVLETLEKHQKLITRGSYLNIETRSIVPQAIRRWNRQDSRHETIRKINTVIDAAIHCSSTSFNIHEYLKKSIVGLQNLKETYATCTQTCARLDILIDKVNHTIQS
jgi:hypothetical protein